MNVETLIIIMVVAIFLAILFFLFRLFNQRKQLKNVKDTITEIEKAEISAESPFVTQTEKKFHGEMDIWIRNEKISTTEIWNQEIRIGRDPLKSNVVIAEPTISKLHCTIFSKENRFFIRDNDSTNGTYINNQRRTEYEIQDNDIVSLGKKGNIQLKFRLSR